MYDVLYSSLVQELIRCCSRLFCVWLFKSDGRWNGHKNYRKSHQFPSLVRIRRQGQLATKILFQLERKVRRLHRHQCETLHALICGFRSQPSCSHRPTVSVCPSVCVSVCLALCPWEKNGISCWRLPHLSTEKQAAAAALPRECQCRNRPKISRRCRRIIMHNPKGARGLNAISRTSRHLPTFAKKPDKTATDLTRLKVYNDRPRCTCF